MIGQQTGGASPNQGVRMTQTTGNIAAMDEKLAQILEELRRITALLSVQTQLRQQSLRVPLPLRLSTHRQEMS